MGAYEAYLPVVLIPYTPDPTNDSTPTLDWWDVVGASTYTLQYSGQSDFSICTEITNITESTYEITDVLSDGVWYWRVRALDSEGVAGWWTTADNFVVEPVLYTLTIVAGTGGTTIPSPDTYVHATGTEVSIKAIPDSGYRFSNWSGDASGTTNTITITMDSDKSIKANFSAIPAAGDETGKKGVCFIATAAYGSSLHSYVRILRDFRDKYLMPSKLGRKMVGLYYKYSPSVANFISKHKVLKVVVKISLLPIIAFSYSMLHFGVIISAVMLVFIFVFPIILILFFRNKKKRLEAEYPKASASRC